MTRAWKVTYEDHTRYGNENDEARVNTLIEMVMLAENLQNLFLNIDDFLKHPSHGNVEILKMEYVGWVENY